MKAQTSPAVQLTIGETLRATLGKLGLADLERSLQQLARYANDRMSELARAINQNEGRAFQLDAAATLPAAAEEHRGRIVFHVGGSGTTSGADRLAICLYDGVSAYSWVTIVEL